jgi:hypothetical protein
MGEAGKKLDRTDKWDQAIVPLWARRHPANCKLPCSTFDSNEAIGESGFLDLPSCARVCQGKTIFSCPYARSSLLSRVKEFFKSPP